MVLVKSTRNATGRINVNKIVLIVLGTLAILMVGSVFIFNSKKTEKRESIVATVIPTQVISRSGSNYVEYSKKIFEVSKNKKRVLFFYANWCPTCIPADADFRANLDRVPNDVILIRVNYNDSETDAEEKTLARKYGITYQHTFVQIDLGENEVAKWNGGQTKELLERIR